MPIPETPTPTVKGGRGRMGVENTRGWCDERGKFVLFSLYTYPTMVECAEKGRKIDAAAAQCGTLCARFSEWSISSGVSNNRSGGWLLHLQEMCHKGKGKCVTLCLQSVLLFTGGTRQIFTYIYVYMLHRVSMSMHSILCLRVYSSCS